jgi:hypothetical protein
MPLLLFAQQSVTGGNRAVICLVNLIDKFRKILIQRGQSSNSHEIFGSCPDDRLIPIPHSQAVSNS